MLLRVKKEGKQVDGGHQVRKRVSKFDVAKREFGNEKTAIIAPANKNARRPEAAGRFNKLPAITYSRACRHYHWPWMLNGRVRNGNGCDHPGMFTEKDQVPLAASRSDQGFRNGNQERALRRKRRVYQQVT